MATADFANYCRQCSDAQLQGVLEKEWEAARGHDRPGASPGKKERFQDYSTAKDEATRRGWHVSGGERVG